jgi:hypothetical protein
MKAYFTRRRLLILLSTVVLTAFLALILRDFVRAYVVLPLLNMGWIAWIGLLSVPQAVFWGLFLLLALYIAVRSLSSGSNRNRARFERAFQRYNSPSRYGYWQIGLKSISRSSYAHERVERELQNLVLQILAEQRHVAVEELRNQQFLDALDLTAETQVIQDLFKLSPHAFVILEKRGLAAWLARLFRRAEPPNASGLDIPGIVVWLEEQTGGELVQSEISSPERNGVQKVQSEP